MTSKIKILSVITKMNTNNESERKSDIFPWDIFNSDIIFIERKILKYLNDILSFFLFNFNRFIEKVSTKK